jgi:hypothetical protein
VRRSAIAGGALVFLFAKSASADDAWFDHLRLGGYLQPQLVWQTTNAAGSPNADANGALPTGIGANATTALPNGATTNPDYFRLRRARFRADVTPTDYARATIEIEPIPKGAFSTGTGTMARTVEGVGIARFSRDVSLEIALGQFNLPFGGEILESNADRPFIDSSWASGNLFPGDFDVGARATLSAGRLTIMSSLVNGAMLGEPTFAIEPDLNRGKDLTLRADYDFGGFWDVGASAYFGSGQLVDPARLRFKQYPRSAANLETTFHRVLAPSLGTTKVVAAITLATDMDRGVTYPFALPAMPSDLSMDVASKQELGWVVRVEQDAGRWLTVGARYDLYTPDTSLANDSRRAAAGVLVVHFTRSLQLMMEYDAAIDRIHAASSPEVSRVTSTVSTVLQARLL